MECFPSFSSPAPDPLAFLQKRVKKRESGAATYFALLPPRLDADNLLPTCQRFTLPRRTRRFSGAPQQEGQASGFCSRGGPRGNSQVGSSVSNSGSTTDSNAACGQADGLCMSRLQTEWNNVEGNPVYTPRLRPLPSVYPPPEDVWAKWRSERENALIQKKSACSGHTATVCQKSLVEPTRSVQTPKPHGPQGHLTFLPAKGAPSFHDFPFYESNDRNPACETHFHEHSTRAFPDTEELCRARRGHRMAREFSRQWLENGLSVRLSSVGKQLYRRSMGCGVEAGLPVEEESSSDDNSSLLDGKCRELSESTGQDLSEMFTHTSALSSSCSGLAYSEDPPVARQSLPPHSPHSKERAEEFLALSTANGRAFSDFPVSNPSVLARCGAHARGNPFRDRAIWAAAGSVSCPGWNACSARVSSFLTNPRAAVSAREERLQARAENNVSLFSDHEEKNQRPLSSAARIRAASIWQAHKRRVLLARQRVEPLQFPLEKDSGEVARVSTSCGDSLQPALERFLPNGEATERLKALKVNRRDRNVLASLGSWYKMRDEKMEVHEPFYSSHRTREITTRDTQDAESEREEDNFVPQTWTHFVREPTHSHSPCRVTKTSKQDKDETRLTEKNCIVIRGRKPRTQDRQKGYFNALHPRYPSRYLLSSHPVHASPLCPVGTGHSPESTSSRQRLSGRHFPLSVSSSPLDFRFLSSVGHSAFQPPALRSSSALQRTEAEARSRRFLPSSHRFRNGGEARGGEEGEGETPEGMRGESVEVGASSAFRSLSREAAHTPVASAKHQTKVRGKREEPGFPVDEQLDNGGCRSRHRDNRGSSVTPTSSRSVSESRCAWRRRRRTLRHVLQQQRETYEAEDGRSIELGEKTSLPELQRVMEKVQRKAGELGRRDQAASVLDRVALSAENCGISPYRGSTHSHLVPAYWRRMAGDTPASQPPHCRASALPSPVHHQLYGCVSHRLPSSCVVLSSSTSLSPRSVSAPPAASSFRYAYFLPSTAAMSSLTQQSLPLAFVKPRLSSPPVNAGYRWRSASSVHAPSVQKRRLLAYVGPVTFSSPWKSHLGEGKRCAGSEEKKIEKPVTGRGVVQLDHFFRLRSLRLPVETAEQILRSPEETCGSWASLGMHKPLCGHSNAKEDFICSEERWRTSLARGDTSINREEIPMFCDGIQVKKGEESHAEENLVHRHQPHEEVRRVRKEPEDSDEDRTRMELNLRSFSHALRELAGELPSPEPPVSHGDRPHPEKGGDRQEEDEQRELSSATRNEAAAGRKDYSDEANSACAGPNSNALLGFRPRGHMRPETQNRSSQESRILRDGFRGATIFDQTRQNRFQHFIEPVRTEQRGHSWRQTVAAATPLSGAYRLEVSGVLGAIRSPCAFAERLSPNTEVSSRSSPCRTCLDGTRQELSGRVTGTQLATRTRTESFGRRAESRRDKREDEETCGEKEETDAWMEAEKDERKIRGFDARDNRGQGRQDLTGSGEEEGTGGEETRRGQRGGVSICSSNASHVKTSLQAITSDVLFLSSYDSLSSCLSTCDCAASTAGDRETQAPVRNRVTSRGDGEVAVLNSLDWPGGREEVASTRGDGGQRKEGTENKGRGEPGEREGNEVEGERENMFVLLGERQRHCASERSHASASPEKKRRLLPPPAFLG